MSEVNVRSKTIVVDRQNFRRKICMDAYIKEKPGNVVKIDEIMSGKRKYKRGKRVSWTLVFNEIKRQNKKIVEVFENHDYKNNKPFSTAIMQGVFVEKEPQR